MIRDLFEKQRPLMIAGLVSFVFGLATAVLIAVDDTQILGINRWIKPMKFFFSIAIFIWTIAVYLYYLKDSERFSRIVSWILIAVFIVEMAAIAGQPLRGTTSHFNVKDPFNGAVFAIMGVAIVISSLTVVALTIKYFSSSIALPPSVVLGMRLGLLIFLAGSVQGGYMSAQLGHTVGAADGGPGLPLTNWSTIAGDLRVAHFAGLHAIQAVPLAALVFERLTGSGARVATTLFAIAYLSFFVLVLIQALTGKPLISI